MPVAVADTQRGVEGVFGTEFAQAVAELPVGVWSGPIRSGLGLHLVLVEERVEGRTPPLVEVHDAVRREWQNARRLEANRQFLDVLLQEYRVSVEWPQSVQAVAMSE